MRIESYEMSMKSEHSFSMSYQKEIDFDGFLQAPQMQDKKLNPSEAYDAEFVPAQSFTNSLKSIDEIIQNLMGMLQKKIQEKPSISVYERYEEHESLSFSTIGHIQTDKGSLDLDLKFNMSRDFVVENRIDIYDSFDPLVINLDGELPQLSQNTFEFDLDNDGESDQISKLGKGSGFLAFDKNDDGIINQGSELFGTISGNGFDELSEYDKDSNNWIDENDSIFDKLRIWWMNDETKDKELVGLGEVGVGAIFLGSTKSEFTYKTSFNETLGEMKSSGIFLNEDGSCGNISQIDFTARSNKDEKESIKPLAELLQA